MSLRWRPLERSVRLRVRRELRGSPDLWNEYRRRRRASRCARAWRCGCSLVLFCLWPAVLMLALKTGETGRRGATALALYATGSALVRGAALLGELYASPATLALLHLPVSDSALFARVQIRFWLQALPAIGVFTLGSRVLGASPGTAVGIGLLLWLGMLAQATLWTVMKPRRVPALVGVFLNVASLVVLRPEMSFAEWISKMERPVLLLLPAGWGAYALRYGVLGGESTALLALVPAAFVVGLLPWAICRLRRAASGMEIVVPQTVTADRLVDEVVRRQTLYEVTALPELIAAPDRLIEYQDELRQSIQEWSERRVLTRESLQVPDWPRAGFLERTYLRFLSPRERGVAALALGEMPRWSRAWKAAVWSALGCSAVFYAVPNGSTLGLIAFVAWPICLFAPFMLATPWKGFQPRVCGNAEIPFYAPFPVSAGELARVVLKADLVRAPAWFALTAGSAVAAAHRLGADLTESLKVVPPLALGAGLFVASSPGRTALRLLKGICGVNVRDITLETLLIVVCPSALAVGAFLFGAVCAFRRDPLEAFGGAFICIGVSWALGRYAKWLVERSRIDRVRVRSG
ncbi:MAG TPA: hypothetical protein VNO22_05875 [Planctomycetota bacterium]|nr:hypothetical protein [Planctomycetota bacterium]